MKSFFRFPNRWLPMLAILGSIGLAWGQPVVCDFDDVPPGVISSDPRLGILFPDGAEVVNVAQTWPGAGAGTFSPPNALRSGVNRVLNIAFAQPVSRVRMRVGNPANWWETEVVLRAYGSMASGAPPVAVARARVQGDSQVRLPLEVDRVFDGDIVRVAVELSGQDYVVIDALEYEVVPSSMLTVISFDDPARRVGERIQNHYDGVTFPDRPEIAGEPVPGGTSSSPYYLQSPTRGEIGDPLPMVIRFNPPQGAVRMRLGSISGITVAATLRAYNDLGMLVATAVTTLSPNAPVTTALEVTHWVEHDINAVEIEYSGNEWECIDDLTFGPFRPGTVADTVAPVVTLTAPASGTVRVQQDWGETIVRVGLTGTIVEAGQIGRVTLVTQQPGVADSHRERDLVVLGSAPNYSFIDTVDFRVGTNTFFVVARDTAENAGFSTVGTYALVRPPLAAVTSIGPTNLGPVYLVRRNPTTYVGGRGDRLSIQGTHLHRGVWVALTRGDAVYTDEPPVNTTYLHTSTMERASDGSWLTVTVVGADDPQYNDTIWRVHVIDQWGDARRWMPSETVSIFVPSYPHLWGFGFKNEGDQTSWDEFDGVFGENAYFRFLGLPVRRLGYILYHPIYVWTLEAIDGSCVGMAATSALLHNGNLAMADFSSNAVMPVGIGAKGDHRYATSAGPSIPLSLWSHIRSNQGVQMSHEFIQCAIDQMSGGGFSIDGAPMDVVSMVRDNPTEWVVCMVPAIGKGHGVLPYKVVGNRIYVYDNNYPFYPDFGPGGPRNSVATNCFIQVTPTVPVGTFVYYVNNRPVEGYSGTGLYAYPLSLWQRPRTGPGLTALRFVGVAIAGSADQECTSSDGGRWGWDADGNSHDALPGAKAVTFIGDIGEDKRQAMLFAPPDRYSSLSFRAHVRNNAPYVFHTMFGGRAFQVTVENAAAGDTDSLNLSAEEQRLNALSFRPQREGVRFVPKVLVNTNEQETLYQWAGLDLPAGEEVEIRAAPTGQHAAVINHSSRTLRPRLLLQTQDNRTRAAMAFEAIAVPAGATCRFVPQQDAGNAHVNAELDLQGTGATNEVIPLVGRNVRIEDNPGRRDDNRNGVVDEVDLLFGSSQDANQNGIPDDAETASARLTPEDGNWAAKAVAFKNTREAELMARTGDIDNLGFGWPAGFSPFSGLASPPHDWPWTPDPADPAGTDRIMVPSSYSGNPPGGADGYAAATSRPENLPQSILLQYADALAGITVTNAVLQLFVDDFQSALWGSQFEVTLNGRRAPFLESVINNLLQTGPVGGLVTVRIPNEFLPDVASGALTVRIDDATTGAGDGFAVDFVKLLINTGGTLYSGSIFGVVQDQAGNTLAGVRVSAANLVETTTDSLGRYTLQSIPAGVTVVTIAEPGFRPQHFNLNVVAGMDSRQDATLVRIQLVLPGVGNLRYSHSIPSAVRNGDLVSVTFDYRTEAAGGERIYLEPITRGDLTPGGSYSPAPLYEGSGTATATFTVNTGRVVVDGLRIQVFNGDRTTLLHSAVVPVEFHFGTVGIGNIAPSGGLVGARLLEQHIDVSYDYDIGVAEGARIFIEPFTRGALSPNYSFSPSGLHFGRNVGSTSVTIRNTAARVDQLHVLALSSDRSQVLVEFFVPVDYNFGSTRIANVMPNRSPAHIVDSRDRVDYSFTYSTTEAEGVRIFLRPFVNGELMQHPALSASPLYTGSGEGSAYYGKTTLQLPQIVDQVQIQVYNADQSALLLEYFLPLPAAEVSFGASYLADIKLYPGPKAKVANQEAISVGFNYRTDISEGVRILAEPFTAGRLSPHYTAPDSPVYPVGSGGDSSWFTIITGHVIVDQIRFQIWNAAQTQLLMSFFVPVAYEFGSPDVSADLGVSIQVLPTSGVVGTEFVYEIIATNAGPVSATNVVVQVPKQADMGFVSATPPADGIVSTDADNLFFRFAVLGAGETRTSSLTLLANHTGAITTSVSIRSDQQDPNLADNAGSVLTEVTNPTADVSVTMSTADAGDVGTRFTYTMIAANAGPDTAANTVVRIPVPNGTTHISSSPPADGSVGTSDNQVIFWMGDLAAGTSRTATMTVQATRRGAIATAATVECARPDPNPDNNVASVIFEVSGPYGGIFLSGEDPDYHGQPAIGPNATGAQRFLARAINYVTFGKLSPRILLLTDLQDPGVGYADSRRGLQYAGYGMDVADSGSGSPDALDFRTVNLSLGAYDAVVVASTVGGWLKQSEIDVLNTRSQDLIQFVNSGGGLVVLSQADSLSGVTFTNAFGFLPAVGFRSAPQVEENFSLTPLGQAMAITESDILGNTSHGIFELTGGLTPVELDASNRIVSLAMRGEPLSVWGVGNQTADLGLELSVSGQSLQVRADLWCNLTVTNLGPNAATRLVLTEDLPAAVEFVDASSDVPFTAAPEAGQLVIRMDRLDASTSARVRVLLRPLQVGPVSIRASVLALQPDPDLGNNAASATTQILPTNQPPTVSLTAPLPGTLLDAPATILLRAEASDDSQVVEVVFIANGAEVGSASTVPFEFVWSGVEGGSYVLLAKAYDEQGLSSLSDLVPIEVRPARPEITGYRLDNNLFWIEWSGGKAQVLGCPDLSLQDWQPLGEPVDSPARIPLTQPMQFFRLMKPGPVN